MHPQIRVFDHLPDGRPVRHIALAGPDLSLGLLTLGATVQDLRLHGVDHPLVLGFPSIAPYFGAGLYVGAIVGRFANRIGRAGFAIDGTEYRVDTNFKGRHLLHGGADGTHHHLWEIEAVFADRAILSLELADGHMGFPGTLRLKADIAVTGPALSITLCAVTDAATPCNLAHHGYFNLDGDGDIRAHDLEIAAESYLPVDDDLIPTGRIDPVAGTDFDFRTARPIGSAGYDHNFCLAQAPRRVIPIARLTGQSGISMTVETTETGLQVYDGRHFKDLAGLDGRIYGPYAGVALETQGWPDAPNHPDFPDPILRPGQRRVMETHYRFARAPQKTRRQGT